MLMTLAALAATVLAAGSASAATLEQMAGQMVLVGFQGDNVADPSVKMLIDEIKQGLSVYEDRQCNASNVLPSVTNTPLQLVNNVTQAVPTAIPSPVATLVGGALPPVTLPPIPQVPLTPEQAEALIPDQLLQQIQAFAFGGATGQGVVAPPCRKQGPFDVGGKKSQYPQVVARSDGK